MGIIVLKAEDLKMKEAVEITTSSSL